MTTLATLKARIADELSRSDLTSQISTAINDAIALYQPKRFYFNETDASGLQFSTVASQETYDKDDLASLEYLYDVDDVFVIVGVNRFRVKRLDPTTFNINRMPYFIGQPYTYMWNNRQFSFSPIPNTAYTMYVLGYYKIAAPASDAEANNPWMTDAERLIRQTAKRMLYQDILLDGEAANACKLAEDEAFFSLAATSNSMSRTGFIQGMAF